ncbi:hypothetical protein ACL2XP_14865 [Sodalis sp. RH21]|uniref:hypothetical protein n=1 Tax=unclassified Sodalis (in: enterobacteria) TaxID=2636512 RepID=UPI0039B51A2B
MSTNSNELTSELIGTDYEGWNDELWQEFKTNVFNGQVGALLLSENQRARLWEIRLRPGERLPAHRHVLDYFWVAIEPGRSLQHASDGTTRIVAYAAGDNKHFTFSAGEYLLHDLENIGDTELVFSTVEFLDSVNTSLPPG